MKTYINEAKANTKDFYAEVEYSMPEKMAREIMKLPGYKGRPKQEALCDYLNTHNCIKGKVTKVLLQLDHD